MKPSFGPDPSWPPLDSGQDGSDPTGPALWVSNAANLSDVHHLTSTRFLCPWFVRMRPNFGPDSSWPIIDRGQDGSGPIGPAPVRD